MACEGAGGPPRKHSRAHSQLRIHWSIIDQGVGSRLSLCQLWMARDMALDVMGQ